MIVEDAMVYCEFNVWNTYVGDYGPIYINDFDADFDEISDCINA